MKKPGNLKKIITAVLILMVAGAIGAYFFLNQSHRDVQAQSADYSYEASSLVSEYLTDAATANDKFLDAEGESKIIEIKGTVAEISTDYNDQKVILLKNADDKAGVSCTFTKETEASISGVTVGQKIKVKGVIRSGASYDEDLELYENVILEKCDLIKQ